MANIKGSLRISQQDFIDRANIVHNNKYNYDLAVFTGITNKVIVTCPIHGNFEQSAHSHINNRCGCRGCARIQRGISKRTKIDEFVLRAKDIHNNKYDYSLVNIKTQHQNIIIICPSHGEFLQSPSNHLAGRGCTKCKYINIANKTKNTLEEFILKSQEKWGKGAFDYSESVYINSYTKVLIKCNIHKRTFNQSPTNHYSQSGCRLCARISKGERAIIKYLENNNINYESEKSFKGCRREGSKNYLKFDFYIPSLNLLIEYDGIQHYEKTLKKYKGFDSEFNIIKSRDEFKNQWAKSNGYKLIRIPYYDFVDIDKILNLLFKDILDVV